MVGKLQVREWLLEQEKGEGKGKSAFAIGAEPQILAGEKRGPLGTGSEPLKDKVAEEAMDVDIQEVFEDPEGRAKGMMKEGKKQVVGFRKSVERKKELEMRNKGWESASFDF